MKQKGKFTYVTIRVVSIICAIVGIPILVLGLLYGYRRAYENYVYNGLCLLFLSLFLSALHYIVKAACLYISKNITEA